MSTSQKTYIAPLSMQDPSTWSSRTSSGRKASAGNGVYMTDRDTVNKVERMKADHLPESSSYTALAVCGCVLGYTLIADEMKGDSLTSWSMRWPS